MIKLHILGVLGVVTLHALSNAAQPVSSLTAITLTVSDVDDYRAYARMEEGERKEFLRKLFGGQTKDKTKWRNEYEAWVKSHENLAELAAGLGLPTESGESLFLALEASPVRLRITFENRLKGLNLWTAFNEERAAWHKVHEDTKLLEENVELMDEQLMLAFEEAQRAYEVPGQEVNITSGFRNRAADKVGNVFHTIRLAPDAWLKHLDSHVDCPGKLLEPAVLNLRSKPFGGNCFKSPDVGAIRDALARGGQTLLAFEFACRAAAGGNSLPVDRLERARLAARLGGYFSSFWAQGPFTTEGVVGSPSGEIANQLTLRWSLIQSHELRSLMDARRIGSKGIDLRDESSDSFVEFWRLGIFDSESPGALTKVILEDVLPKRRSKIEERVAAGASAARTLEALASPSPDTLEVLGVQALVDKRSGAAFDYFERSLGEAGDEAPNLLWANVFHPIAHVLARGTEGLRESYERAVAASGSEELVVNLMDAWNCSGFLLSVLDPEDASKWRTALAMRWLRVGDAKRGEELFGVDRTRVEPRDIMVEAWLLEGRGRHAEALAIARKALEEGGASDFWLCRSARLLNQEVDVLNDLYPKSAERILDIVRGWAEAYPGSPGVEAELAYLLLATGQELDEAVALLGRVQATNPDAAATIAGEVRDLSAKRGARVDAALGLDPEVRDAGAGLRLAAAQLSSATTDSLQGTDYLYLVIENDSRAATGGRALIFFEHDVFGRDFQVDVGAKVYWEPTEGAAPGLAEAPFVTTLPSGEPFELGRLRLLDGRDWSLEEYRGDVLVLPVMGVDSLRAVNSQAWSSLIEELTADEDCRAALLFFCQAEVYGTTYSNQFVRVAQQQPWVADLPVALSATATRGSKLPCNSYPSISVMDRTGAFAYFSYSELNKVRAHVEAALEKRAIK